MNWSGRKYKDRFGDVWSVRVELTRGRRTHVAFTCSELRLVAGGPDEWEVKWR